MPVISRFNGIVVMMFYEDPSPPHFHAHYSGKGVVVEIETGAIHGRLPQRSLRLLREWRKLRSKELRANWERARENRPLMPIQPLE